MNFLIVGAGGFLGSALRYGISLLMRNVGGASFPWGTLVVNTVGCLAMGLIGGYLEKNGRLDSPLFLLVGVGILGGFTTYSAYGWETMVLIRNQQMPLALLNIAGNFGLGFLAIAVGRYWAAN